MSRLPILVRLTAAFAAATLLVVAAAAVFVTLRLRADEDDRVNANLRTRSAAAARALADGTDLESVAVEDPEESFAQVLDGAGVLETAGSVAEPALTHQEFVRARQKVVVVERHLEGVDGNARIRASAVETPDGLVVVAIGQSLLDRDEAVASVVTSFLVGGLAAVVAASALGYGLARAGLAPVEAMRVRASEISAGDDDADGLPLPEAHDQLRRLGVTLNDMLGRLRDSYARERRFVEDASHELRTPLAVIKTDLEGALMTGDHSPRATAALRSALDETDRLARVADDLLVLTRADDKQLPLQPTTMPVGDLFAWVVTRFERRCLETGRAIVVDPGRDLTVYGDEDRLRQTLFNLVDNALRHGSGTVTLSAQPTDNGVEIDVTDEGDGFTPEAARHVFERFARVESGRHTTGAGLGLAIVDAIVGSHRGRVWVSVGRPTAVHVWLPDRTAAPHRPLTRRS